jgi:NAD-dependent dihydropyrimidine dehydrogenase PreA subunit
MKKRREFLASAGLLAMWPYSLVHTSRRLKSATATNLPRLNSLIAGNRLPNPGYVIAEPCIGTKDTACVDVCPVDCIHPRKDEEGFAKENMLYIDAGTCIDCGACEPACPVQAIFTQDDTPEQWKAYIKINADYYKKK